MWFKIFSIKTDIIKNNTSDTNESLEIEEENTIRFNQYSLVNSCITSASLTNIKIWNNISPFNEIESLKEDEPVISILELKHNLNNNILVSCCWGYINLWNIKTYTKEKTINDVSINSSNGLIELPNGNISLSDNNSIIIVNPCKASIIKVIKDDYLISWGALCLLNEQSFIYVCQGSFVHISADTFKIMFRSRFDKGDLVGEAGVCVEEKGKYAVIDNEYGGFGFFEFEYNI